MTDSTPLLRLSYTWQLWSSRSLSVFAFMIEYVPVTENKNRDKKSHLLQMTEKMDERRR